MTSYASTRNRRNVPIAAGLGLVKRRATAENNPGMLDTALKRTNDSGEAHPQADQATIEILTTGKEQTHTPIDSIGPAWVLPVEVKQPAWGIGNAL